MSSGEDSETAEWEREQMLRGTQSRRMKSQPSKLEKSSDAVDTASVRKHVYGDIEKTEAKIESIKRNIGSTKLDIVRSEKKLDAIRNHVATLQSSDALFKELGSLADPKDVLDLIERQRSTITKLPHDQREMIDLLEERLKGESQPPMDVD